MLTIDMQKKYQEFNNKNLGDYRYLHVQIRTLLSADVFENLLNKYIEIYELDPAHFLSAKKLCCSHKSFKTSIKS